MLSCDINLYPLYYPLVSKLSLELPQYGILFCPFLLYPFLSNIQTAFFPWRLALLSIVILCSSYLKAWMRIVISRPGYAPPLVPADAADVLRRWRCTLRETLLRRARSRSRCKPRPGPCEANPLTPTSLPSTFFPSPPRFQPTLPKSCTATAHDGGRRRAVLREPAQLPVVPGARGGRREPVVGAGE